VRFEEQRIRAEADRRMQEAERLQDEAAVAPLNTFGEPPAVEPPVRSDAESATGSVPEPQESPVLPDAPGGASAPLADFSFAEQRLQEGRAARERSMAEAERRLREIDERTKAAEERAATAKRLEGVRAEEETQQQRLEEMQRAVDEAEQRARVAEQRAREAEEAVVRGLAEITPSAPIDSPPAQSFAPIDSPPAPPSAPVDSSPAPSFAPEPLPPAPSPPTAAPAVTTPSFPSSPPPPVSSPAAAPLPAGDGINLNSVTFEQLRSQDLSVTQATRLLAHRERLGGFNSVDDLDQVAGFPDDVLADLKSRATV
jgi:hypothetical protein